MKKLAFTALAAVAAGVLFAMSSSVGNAGVTFKGKTVTMIIPTTPGGSTDLAARLVAKYLAVHLPGKPSIVASNVPGGHGVSALNFVVEQAKPDGLTVTMSSNSQVDPITYRAPQAHYDPAKFEIVGGIGIGDNIMIIRTDALPRLYDKTKKPVAMGSVAGIPRSGMRMNIWGTEFLGWNTRWVVGYPGSTDLVLALERGEIDMTSFPRFYVVDRLTDTKKFKIIYLDGLRKDTPLSGRADADNAPLFTKAMAGQIKDPKIMAAYNYWQASTIFKWIALPPKTPNAIRDVYRHAFDKMVKDPAFTKKAKTTIEGFTVIEPKEMEKMIDELAATSDQALATMDSLLRKEGINPESVKKKKSKTKS